MSNQDLPPGAFITQLNGRRCTAVPRSNAAAPAATSAAAGDNGNNNNNGGGAGVGSQSVPTPAADSSTNVQIQTENDGEAASTTTFPPPPTTPSPTQEQEQEQEPEPAQETSAQARPIPPPVIPPLLSPSTLFFPSTLPSPTKVAQGAQNPSFQTQASSSLASSATNVNTAVPDVPEQADANNDQQQQQPEQQAPAPTPAPAPIPPENAAPDVVNGNIATTAVPGSNGAAAVGEGVADPSTTTISDGSTRSGAPTAVVAGSVAGGVAVVSLIAFLLWFWRKKKINRRRSSLLTPLTIEPSTLNGGNNEKSYIIERGSVGPTPKTERIKAAVGARFQGLRGKSSGSRSGPSVDLRSGSQYDDASLHSRNNSSSLSLGSGNKDVVTGKDRFKDWWSRVTADVNFNWKMRNDRTMDADPAAAVRNVSERKGSQPDFLTLLGMDEKEVQREAQNRQANHSANGSAGSANHFLGGLNLNFDSANNPFSDINALSHESAKPPPLTVSPRANPFSDANAVSDKAGSSTKPPSTYVADVRRSRGLGQKRQPSVVDSVYRESVASVDNFDNKRNKFRSDPFDLERPELLGSRQDLTTANMMAADGQGVRGSVNKPRRAHTRDDSLSSKYSSGFSLGDWSDPGPDVGPGSTRWDSPTPDDDYRPGSRQRGGSKGSNGSVGKAL